MGKKNQIDSLKTRLVSRGWTLAKTGLKAGSLAAGQAVRSALRSAEAKERIWARFLTKQAEMLATELGQLKGSAMKVGQLLSVYGEHFLPPEANEILKSLQSKSPALKWSTLEPVAVAELGRERLSEIEIDPEPWAAASIGQVHRARRRHDGQEIALKIQYPGVEAAIETDLRFLRRILNLGAILPKGPRFDAIFQEIRDMLYREVNYRLEREATEQMALKLKDDPRYRVARTFPEFSGTRVLATEFIHGETFDSPRVQNLPQNTRNEIGRAFLELYLRELFEFHVVQTDPHFGNYRVEFTPAGGWRLALLDFGAVREVPENFLRQFARIMRGSLMGDANLIEQGGRALNLLLAEDPPELVRHYAELCFLITEPFQKASAVYDWGASDLPKRVAQKGSEIVFGYHLRAPPQEMIFLDRKLGGTFVVLSKLKCRFAGRDLVLSALDRSGF